MIEDISMKSPHKDDSAPNKVDSAHHKDVYSGNTKTTSGKLGQRHDTAHYLNVYSGIPKMTYGKLGQHHDEANAIVMFNWGDHHMYSYKPTNQPTKKWSKMEKISEIYYGSTAVVSGKHIYLLKEQELQRLEYSDPASKWEQMSSMLIDHGKYPPACVLNGFIYVCGGGDPLRFVERYDAARDQWERICDTTYQRRHSCVVATKFDIYCIGGSNDVSVERYDERSNRWDLVKSTPGLVDYASAGVVNNRIYVANDKGVLCYDIQKNSWSKMNLSNQWHFMNGGGVKILALNEELYIMGKIRENSAMDAIYLLKPEIEQMTLVEMYKSKTFVIHNCLAVSEKRSTAEASSELRNQQTTADQSSVTTSMAQLSITDKVNAIIMFIESDDHLYSYNLPNKEWSRMQEFTDYGLQTTTKVASGKHIYILYHQEVHQLEYSDPAAKWKKMSSMIEDHGSRPPAAVLNVSIYVCGGGRDVGAEASQSVERYDADLDRWDHMRHMNTGKWHPCIVAIEDNIYCMGGKDKQCEPLQSVERFVKRLDKWEFVESLPRPILWASAAAVKNRIYVADPKHDGVLCYDIQNNSWSEMNLANQWPFIKNLFLKILAVDGELYIIGYIRSKTAIYLLKPETEQMNLVEEFEGQAIDVNTCLAAWHLLESRASNKDKNKKLNMIEDITMKYDSTERQEFQDNDNEARQLMDIQFEKIKSETSGTFTLCHQKLIESDAEYFCFKLKPDLLLKELKFRNCNVDGKFLLAIKKDGKVEHVDFSGNNQIDLPVLTDLLIRWECKSLDLSDIEFDEKKMNGLRHILELTQLKTLILNYSSFSATSNDMGHVAKLLQNLENLSFIASTISTDQLVLIADNLSDRIKLQSLNLTHVQLEDEGIEAVCKIINKTDGMKKLSLPNSGLTAEKLEVFSKKVTQKFQIEELDLGLNRNIRPTDFKKIIEIVKRQRVQKLNLIGLSLNQQAMEQLTKSDIPPGQIIELNISENPGICISDVGELAAKLEIRNLDISECWFRVDDLKKLPSSMKNHKLRWIDVTESSRELNKKRRKEIRTSLHTVADEVRFEH